MLGRHIIIDVKNIKDSELIYLCDVKELDDMFFSSVPDYLELEVVKQCRFQFKPFGGTILYLLTTSHASIHTFVEEHSFSMDIFTCSEDVNLLDILDYIKRFWDVTDSDIQYRLIER